MLSIITIFKHAVLLHMTYIWRGERGKHKDCREQKKKAEVPSLLELSRIHQDQGTIDAIRALSNAQNRSTDKHPSSGQKCKKVSKLKPCFRNVD